MGGWWDMTPTPMTKFGQTPDKMSQPIFMFLSSTKVNAAGFLNMMMGT